MSNDDLLAQLAELAKGIPGPLDHRRQFEIDPELERARRDAAAQATDAARYALAPFRLSRTTMDPDAAAALRARLLDGFPDAAPLVIPPVIPAVVDELGRSFSRMMVGLGDFAAALWRGLEPTMSKLAELAKNLDLIEYQCREERRQHRRNPSPTTLMHRAYRARRRRRW